MALSHGIVSVGTTATALNASLNGGKDGSRISVQNPTGGSTVYLGASGVTTSSYGFLLAAGTTFSIELNQGEALFGVVASSTQSVAVLRQGV
jgi:hypothetical protein